MNSEQHKAKLAEIKNCYDEREVWIDFGDLEYLIARVEALETLLTKEYDSKSRLEEFVKTTFSHVDMDVDGYVKISSNKLRRIVKHIQGRSYD